MKRDPSLKKIMLYGDAGRKFGRVHWLAVKSTAEAIRALCALKPEFAAYLRANFDRPFRVLRGEEALDEEGLLAPVSRTEVIKIVPVVAGAKDGWGQILLGAALIAVGVAAWMYLPGATATTGDWLINAGMAMVLGGVAGLLATTPKGQFSPTDNGSNAETFSFSNPTLTTGQGGAVPVLYGTMRIGGHVISAGIDAHTWQVGGFDKAICLTDDGTQYGNGDSIPWMWAKAEA